eukprot:5748759-Alexandrium_andersonii.AAC.1
MLSCVCGCDAADALKHYVTCPSIRELFVSAESLPSLGDSPLFVFGLHPVSYKRLKASAHLTASYHALAHADRP